MREWVIDINYVATPVRHDIGVRCIAAINNTDKSESS